MVKVNYMKRYIVPITLLAASALSCQTELIPDRELSQDMIDLIVEAVVETDADTKTSLGGENTSDYRDVLWNIEDEIAFFAEGESSYSKFVNQNEQDAQKTALFYGSVQKSGSYAAFYPYSAVQSLGQGKVNFTFPPTQIYQKDGFADGMSPMVGRLSDETLAFKNLCGMLVLNLVGKDEVSSITFNGYDASGNPIPVSGEVSVAYSYSSAPTIDMGMAQGYSVTLDCGDGIQLSETEAMPFHIILPPGEYSSFELEIWLTNGKMMRKKGVKPLQIDRSVRTKTGEFTVIGRHENTDISANGTANCYVINEAGGYKFKAVKGNSSTSVGSVSSVSVLWESFGTNTPIFSGDLINTVSYSDGYIRFYTSDSFKEGNAVIAAKDSSGDILWSWHIWLTDQPEEQVYYNNAGTMMDRNLGATSATPGDVGALGLLYQWGRKDPFPGSSSINSADKSIAYAGSSSWIFYTTVANERGRVSKAIENPMDFYPGFSKSDYDWVYSSRDDDLWYSEKTIYDPCPAGWRVPDGGTDGIWAKACGSTSFTCSYDSLYEGINFSGKFGDASVIWYPATGHRRDSEGRLVDVGSDGYYWSASSSYKLSYSMEFDDSGYVRASDSDWRACGKPVRCQKENTSIPEDEALKTY